MKFLKIQDTLFNIDDISFIEVSEYLEQDLNDDFVNDDFAQIEVSLKSGSTKDIIFKSKNECLSEFENIKNYLLKGI